MTNPTAASRKTIGATLLAAGLAALLAACSPQPTGTEPAAVTADRDPSILVPIYFYHGYSVGKGQRSSGLQVSRDGGRTFGPVAWKELIANSATVDASGRWIYLACGNGVLMSRDAGQTWWLTGGCEVTEVQRIAVDRRNPCRVWAATAYGLFANSDTVEDFFGWYRYDARGLFRYCTDVRQDAAEPDTIWVASDRGVFVLRDPATGFEASLAGVDARRLWQDSRDARRLWAATDGRGLMATSDGGATWQRVDGPPDVTFCVTGHPDRPDTLLVGTMEGLFVSPDLGRSWSVRRDDLPDDYFVYGAAVDPADPERLLVAGNDGLFAWSTERRRWERLGFEDALIHDIATADLARVPRAGPPTEGFSGDLAGFVLSPPPPDLGPDPWPQTVPGVEERRRELLDHFRDRVSTDKPWAGWTDALVRARSGAADPDFWTAVREQLSHPEHSMFYTLQLMAFYLHGGDRLPADIRERIGTILTEVPVYRGDTENHWTMYYSVLMLAAQTWERTSRTRWYMGQPTDEIQREARAWLEHWAGLTATRGQGEFDSPNYMFMYVTPMLLLYDFTKSWRIKRLAGMMLDLLLADYFTESLHGAWCGGHSRIIGKEVEKTTANRVSVFHWLWAGGIDMPENIHGWAYYAALSSYRPPAVLEAIANRRDTPYVHTELKRVRNVIRFGRELNPPVHKYDFMTALYGMGSLQGGILQPLQQHTWDVTWLGSGQNATLFTVHPEVSARELAMFFPEHVRDITRTITRQKGEYASPDKWISASAYERVFQHERVLLALYQVPPGEQFPHVNLYWPKCLARTEQDGWWFGRDGEFFLACHSSRPGTWTDLGDHERFRCPADRAGFVVIARPVGGDFGEPVTFEVFRQSVLSGKRPELTGTGDRLALAFTNAASVEYRKVWGEADGRIDGRPVPFPAEWLFRGPFITSRAGSGVITLTDGKIRRELDFNEFTVHETP